MANGNFVVQNGLQVGPLTIDAATGSINTSGTVSVGGVSVSEISKNDSSIRINDTGASGSNVAITIDGIVEHTIDASGVNLQTGDGYSINGSSVLTATTLGSGVLNSSLTSLGVVTALSATTGVVTNLSAANLSVTNGSVATLVATTGLSTANAIITNLSGTTGVITNFSSGNVQLSGADTISTATGALRVTGGAAISGNAYIGTNLYIGSNAFTAALTNPTVIASDNGSTYAQMAMINNTATGSADLIVYPSNYPGASNDHGWADLGFTGPSFNDPVYSITKAHDAYVFGSGLSPTYGGNLVLATDFSGSYNDVVIGVGSFYANSEVARFHGNATTSGYFALTQGTAASSTATGALRVTGGAGITGALYAGSLYDNSNRVMTSFSSSGVGNLTVSVSNPTGTTIALPATGPGATTTGSATAIPVITTDAYGRIAGITTAAVSSTLNIAGSSGTGTVSLTSQSLTVAGGTGVTTSASGQTVTVSIPQAVATTSTPTFAGLTINGTITATALNAGTVGNVGASVIGATGRFDTSVTTNTLNAATIGNASATLTGGTLNISGAGSIGTLVATNFSTGNAQITSCDTTTMDAATGVITNFSTGNARVTGGYADNFPIGANTKSTGAFTTLTATGVTQITNATNNSGSNYTTGALQVTGGVGVGGQMYVGGDIRTAGNIYAANLISTSTTTLEVTAPMVYLESTSVYPYNYEIGTYSHFIGGPANVYAHTGTIRDHNNGYWTFFSNVKTEPTGGVINWADAGLIYDTIKSGDLVLANTTTSTSTTTGALRVAGGAGIAGALNAGSLNITGGTNAAGGLTASTVSAGTIGNASATLTGGQGSISGGFSAGTLVATNFSTGNAQITSCNATTMDVTTGVIDNFSTGNAIITNGVVTTGVITNFSTGNARVTGGYADNFPIGANTKSTGAFTTLTATGNVDLQNTVYGRGVYDNSVRVVSTSSGAGNLTISSGAVNLTAAGPGAVSVGSSTAIPVITTDAYGRIAGTTTAAVVAPAGTLSGATLAAGVTASSLTSVGTLTGLTISGQINSTVATGTAPFAVASTTTVTNLNADLWDGNHFASYLNQAVLTSSAPTFAGLTTSAAIVPNANSTVNIGSTSAYFATVYGTAWHALYADLAENYRADKAYNPGTVVMFGGSEEVTLATPDTSAVAGVVSTNPATLMNGGLVGSNVVPLALQGRVPCMVVGPVKKGDMMVSAGWGYAKASADPKMGQVIGKALEDFPLETKGIIEVVIGRL